MYWKKVINEAHYSEKEIDYKQKSFFNSILIEFAYNPSAPPGKSNHLYMIRFKHHRTKEFFNKSDVKIFDSVKNTVKFIKNYIKKYIPNSSEKHVGNVNWSTFNGLERQLLSIAEKSPKNKTLSTPYYNSKKSKSPEWDAKIFLRFDNKGNIYVTKNSENESTFDVSKGEKELDDSEIWNKYFSGKLKLSKTEVN